MSTVGERACPLRRDKGLLHVMGAAAPFVCTADALVDVDVVVEVLVLALICSGSGEVCIPVVLGLVLFPVPVSDDGRL